MIEAPPVEKVVVPTLDSSCPVQFTLCLDVDAGLAYESNLKMYRRYVKEVWNRCASDGGGAVVRPDAGM